MKDNNRTYGIEIEFFGADREAVAHMMRGLGLNCVVEGYNHETRNHWKIVTDVSVRDGRGRGGFELVSPPLKGEEGLDQIRKACEALQKVGAKVNKSCGLHVHHHVANDYKSKNFVNLIHFYAKAEKEIDKMMPLSRRGNTNQYCNSMTSGFNLDDVMSCRNDRYFKVNLNSFYRYGTVEFRHHSGTVEADKIINWVNLTQRMVLRAKKKVTSYNDHSLTWYDIKQALGLVHGAGQVELDLVDFYENRRTQLAA